MGTQWELQYDQHYRRSTTFVLVIKVEYRAANLNPQGSNIQLQMKAMFIIITNYYDLQNHNSMIANRWGSNPWQASPVTCRSVRKPLGQLTLVGFIQLSVFLFTIAMMVWDSSVKKKKNMHLWSERGPRYPLYGVEMCLVWWILLKPAGLVVGMLACEFWNLAAMGSSFTDSVIFIKPLQYSSYSGVLNISCCFRGLVNYEHDRYHSSRTPKSLCYQHGTPSHTKLHKIMYSTRT